MQNNYKEIDTKLLTILPIPTAYITPRNDPFHNFLSS